MRTIKYLKIEVSGAKKEIQQYFEFIESAEGVKIEELCHCQICKGWTCKDERRKM